MFYNVLEVKTKELGVIKMSTPSSLSLKLICSFYFFFNSNLHWMDYYEISLWPWESHLTLLGLNMLIKMKGI